MARGFQTLSRRLGWLESSRAEHQARVEPEFSEEDLAIMQRIIERTYADPERYAARIAIFERGGSVAATGIGCQIGNPGGTRGMTHGR